VNLSTIPPEAVSLDLKHCIVLITQLVAKKPGSEFKKKLEPC
jgi:hypothetical protein